MPGNLQGRYIYRYQRCSSTFQLSRAWWRCAKAVCSNARDFVYMHSPAQQPACKREEDEAPHLAEPSVVIVSQKPACHLAARHGCSLHDARLPGGSTIDWRAMSVDCALHSWTD